MGMAWCATLCVYCLQVNTCKHIRKTCVIVDVSLNTLGELVGVHVLEPLGSRAPWIFPLEIPSWLYGWGRRRGIGLRSYSKYTQKKSRIRSNKVRNDAVCSEEDIFN